MINIKQLSQRYKIYDYNIGLIKATPTDVIFGNFDLCSVHWLKHKYRDRMFADPFILKETDDTLEILAEEALFLGGAATSKEKENTVHKKPSVISVYSSLER